jgi:Tol biopolymer transport system component
MRTQISCYFLLLLVAGCVAESDSPRGIVFVSDRGEGEEIYVIEPDGSNERRLTHSGEGKGSRIPFWSPDGSRIAFASDRDGERGKNSIYVMNADGSNVQRLTDHGGGDYTPTWSPDAQRIAFMSSRDGNGEIYVMDPDGSNLRRLTHQESFDCCPFWVPDGSKILFNSVGDQADPQSWGVYRMNPDGTDVERLAVGGVAGWWPDRRVLVGGPSDSAPAEWAFFLMNVDGSDVQSLEEVVQFGADHPRGIPCGHSRDGAQIAFQAVPGQPVTVFSLEHLNKIEIFVMDVDGSNVRRLTHNEFGDGHCNW